MDEPEEKRGAPVLYRTCLCLPWLDVLSQSETSTIIQFHTANAYMCVCVGVHTHSVEEQEQEDKKVLEGGEGVFGCFRSAPLYNTGSSSIGSSADL